MLAGSPVTKANFVAPKSLSFISRKFVRLRIVCSCIDFSYCDGNVRCLYASNCPSIGNLDAIRYQSNVSSDSLVALISQDFPARLSDRLLDTVSSFVRSITIYWGAYPVPMFPGTYVHRYICSLNLCFSVPMFPICG